MTKVKAIPDGCEGMIPHLVVNDAAKALAFYKTAFGGEETLRMPSPDGRILHAELRIGGAKVFLADDFPEMCGGRPSNPLALEGTPVTIHHYVTDADAAIRRAETAGAKVLMPAADMFWRDRYGMVEDPFGHRWSFATHQKDMTPDELRKATAQAFSQAPPPSGNPPPRPK